MLNPEQAVVLLKEFEAKDSLKKMALAALMSQPSTRKIANLFLGLKENGSPSAEDNQWQKRENAFEYMNANPNEDIRPLFVVLFPKIAGHVETAWRRFRQQPYLTDGNRRSFRAPNNPELTLKARQNWLYSLFQTTQKYDQDLAWYAAWAPYLGWGNDELGYLFSAAIDAGGEEGEEIFQILVASAKGEHEIGANGRHVSRALLTSSRIDAWEFMEKFLIAAQRQEGLRQVILETVDEAHPEAFRRMLRLILEHDLLRFSATLRAFDVWFGFGYDVETLPKTKGNKLLGDLLDFIENPELRERAITSGEAESAYLALCAGAFANVMTTVPKAFALLKDASPERRYVGVKFLGETSLVHAQQAGLSALQDPDLRVAWQAMSLIGHRETKDRALFDALEKFLIRLAPNGKASAEKELPEIVWPWTATKINVQNVSGALVRCCDMGRIGRTLPYLSLIDSYRRSEIAKILMTVEYWDDPTRKAVFELAGDTAEWVRNEVFAGLQKTKIRPVEAETLENLLTRKAASLRQGVLTVLLKQDDEAAFASADRLVSVTNAPQRLAGLEILQEMAKENRKPDACRARAKQYQASVKKTSTDEETLLNNLLSEKSDLPTIENGLGIYNPADCTPVIPPKSHLPETSAFDKAFTFGKSILGLKSSKQEGFLLKTGAPKVIFDSLVALIDKHKEAPINLYQPGVERVEQLLGDINWGFPTPNFELSLEEDMKRLPLREVWEEWWRTRPANMRDADGFELLRLHAAKEFANESYYRGSGSHEKMELAWKEEAEKKLYCQIAKNNIYRNLIDALLQWILRYSPHENAFDFLLNAFETTLANVPEAALRFKSTEEHSYNYFNWTNCSPVKSWGTTLDAYLSVHQEEWTQDHARRYWNLLHWMDKPLDGAQRNRPALKTVCNAFQSGEASEADVYDQIIGSRTLMRYSRNFDEIRLLTRSKPSEEQKKYPFLKEIVDKCVRRSLEIELERGEMLTPASDLAASIRSLKGADRLIQFLTAYGAKEPFVRGSAADGNTRRAVFSHLIRVSFPSEEDTFESFAAQATEAKIGKTRLIEMAMFAPQWAKWTDQFLGWSEFEEAIWWIHAHTKDNSWSVDQQIREEWTAQTAERTPLTGANLLEGAVDVAWFKRIYASLGKEKWMEINKAAKYASGGGGHKRAQLFADAMLGKLTQEELTARITDKRTLDAVRALGLVPLPEDPDDLSQTLLTRYKTLQEFLRTSKQFGSMRQASEKLATEIGMENLARTAGFADPNRLQWAMEREAVADLESGSGSVTAEEVVVTLSINALGKPEIAVAKNGKELKTVPPKVKKEDAVAELFVRKREIERQSSRMRLSLEEAMCRGDAFRAREILDLYTHPVLAPMLRSLVFMSETVIGYPVEGGSALENHDGSAKAIPKNAELRIAHPHDLLQIEEWNLWQQDCFLRERIQPFKQMYRELYSLTEAEKKDARKSLRYEGHQVNPRQALALAGGRGWISSYEEGVRRTFHAEGITAHIEFDQYFTTPAEVEGLTVQNVSFTLKGEWKPIELSAVPPRVFSEAMRDVDLIVSVAHAGGVDPEASHSTVEMRTALLRETLRWLKITNVRFESSHALIDGSLGTYSVHLGSAVVHRQPGGYLCIVPVHAQHRGRLFLPFADNDPKTAEVISKVLMLAKDKEIKDPVILEQILPKGAR